MGTDGGPRPPTEGHLTEPWRQLGAAEPADGPDIWGERALLFGVPSASLPECSPAPVGGREGPGQAPASPSGLVGPAVVGMASPYLVAAQPRGGCCLLAR